MNHNGANGWVRATENEHASIQEQFQVPGVAAMYFTPDEVRYEYFHGVRDEAGNPVTPDTRFGIASVTKSFTALAILQLASAGKLAVTDPVTKVLPELAVFTRGVPTIADFMKHTSGLPPVPTMPLARAASQAGDPVTGGEATQDVPPLTTMVELMDWLNAHVTVHAAPGEWFSYSNDAFVLLGEIVTRVSGMPFEQWVEERICAPLGMTRTTFDLQAVLADDNTTTLYATGPDGRVVPSPTWQEAPPYTGGGALRSTANDLVRYVRALMDLAASPLGVNEKLAKSMRSALTSIAPNSYYGYGLQITAPHHHVTLIGHGGSLKGVSSYIGYVPELNMGGVVLTNVAGVPSERTWLTGLNAYMGAPLGYGSFVPKPYPVTVEQIHELAGTYRSGEPWGVATFTLTVNHTLMAEVGEPAERGEVLFVGEDHAAIELPRGPVEIVLIRDSLGALVGIRQGLRVLLRVED